LFTRFCLGTPPRRATSSSRGSPTKGASTSRGSPISRHSSIKGVSTRATLSVEAFSVGLPRPFWLCRLNSLDQLKPADVTEFKSVTSLVNSDLLTRTACKRVRDTKIPNQPPNKKWKFLYDGHSALRAGCRMSAIRLARTGGINFPASFENPAGSGL
jgi:hypothetical protein